MRWVSGHVSPDAVAQIGLVTNAGIRIGFEFRHGGPRTGIADGAEGDDGSEAAVGIGVDEKRGKTRHSVGAVSCQT